MTIAREEIFGPVLVDPALRERGTGDRDRQRHGLWPGGLRAVSRTSSTPARSRARLRAGQVKINYPAWDTVAPFGGYKQSGNGREYADWGIHEFLEIKGIIGYGAS